MCSSFQAKILNDQLCYEVDLNNFSNKSNIEKELKVGFVFFMDYNEDRQTPNQAIWKGKDKSFGGRIVNSEKEYAAIYLNNIGKKQN